jgi:choline dehydrogenase-like flavoprotein
VASASGRSLKDERDRSAHGEAPVTDDALAAEVAIVGSGVAGALVAAKLAQRGVDVALIEAGPKISRSDALDAYYKAPVRGLDAPYPKPAYAPYPLRSDPDGYCIERGPDPFGPSYLRVVGGTTWHWEATCLRLLPEDLRLRSRFGLAVDWPLSYDALEPWYGAAERELGVAGAATDDLGSPRSDAYPLPAMPLSYLDLQVAKALAGSPYLPHPTPQARNTVPWNDRPTCCGSASCVPICPSAAKYDATVHVEQAVAAGAQLLDRSVVYRIDVDGNRRITGLRFRRPERTEGHVRAKVYVLAAHGIETPKLLLISRSERSPDGIANSSGLVGRNLMDHPYKLSWALTDQPLWPYRGPIRLSGVDSTRRGEWRAERPAFRISIDNAALSWPLGGPVATVRALIGEGLRGADLQRAIRHQTSRQIGVFSMTEQLPDPANRIEPDFERRDALGIPRPQIHFRLDDYTGKGLAFAETVHEQIFGLIGTTAIQHRAGATPGSHIMGTYRMGEDPRTSVVDPDLRAHDHANLFLLGSGVFPTGGAANPTLTIAALALRAADPIRDAVQA